MDDERVHTFRHKKNHGHTINMVHSANIYLKSCSSTPIGRILGVCGRCYDSSDLKLTAGSSVVRPELVLKSSTPGGRVCKIGIMNNRFYVCNRNPRLTWLLDGIKVEGGIVLGDKLVDKAKRIYASALHSFRRTDSTMILTWDELSQ
jgi:hypothetical protein